MADVQIYVKIDGVEYTQEQLKELATGAKTATKATEDLKKETKKAGEEQGYFAKKVADIKEQFGKLKAGFGDIKKGYASMTSGLSSMAKGFGLSGKAANVFGKTTSAAIAATGIGLIIPLVLMLVNYFSNLEGAAKLLKKAMATLGAIIANIGDAMQKVLSLDFAGAWDGITGSVKAANAAVDSQFEAEKKLAQLRNTTIIQNAKLNASIEANKKVLEDTTLSLDERIKALDGVTAATKTLAENQIIETKLALQSAEAQLVLTNNYEERREKQLEIAELQASLIDQQTQLANVEYDAEKVAREIRTAAAAERKAQIEERLAQEKTVADTIRDLRIEDIQDEQSKAEAILQVQKEAALKTLVDNKASKTVLAEAETLYQNQLEKLRTTYSDKASAEAIASKEKKDAEDKIELDKAAAKATRLNEILVAAGLESIENQFTLAQEELLIEENKLMAELDLLGASEEQKQKVRDQYKKKREKLASDEVDFNKALKKEELDAALDTAVAAFGAIQALTKEGSAANKAAAIAATAINTYKAAMSAYADTPGGPIIKGIAAAVAIATGIAAVRNIVAVPEPEGGGGSSAAMPSIKNPAASFSSNSGSIGLGQGPSFGDSGAMSEMNGINNTNSRESVPIRAYVVATEMTDIQEANKKVEDIARL